MRVNTRGKECVWRFEWISGCSMGNVVWLCSVLVLSSIGLCQAEILSQMNVESDEMAPWETFVTPNGTVGETGWPLVELFETAEEGESSKALKFKVGQRRHEKDGHPEQGGGMVILITTKAGTLNLSAHVAVTYHSPKDRQNLAGGLFEWIVDDQVIASHDIGPIKNDGLLRHHFDVHYTVAEGLHRIRLGIIRPFTSIPGQHAPFQYVDNLVVRLTPHPVSPSFFQQ